MLIYPIKKDTAENVKNAIFNFKKTKSVDEKRCTFQTCVLYGMNIFCHGIQLVDECGV